MTFLFENTHYFRNINKIDLFYRLSTNVRAYLTNKILFYPYLTCAMSLLYFICFVKKALKLRWFTSDDRTAWRAFLMSKLSGFPASIHAFITTSSNAYELGQFGLPILLSAKLGISASFLTCCTKYYKLFK